MVTFYLLLGYILQEGYTPPQPPIALTNTQQQPEEKKPQLCIYKSVILLSHMLAPLGGYR